VGRSRPESEPRCIICPERDRNLPRVHWRARADPFAPVCGERADAAICIHFRYLHPKRPPLGAGCHRLLHIATAPVKAADEPGHGCQLDAALPNYSEQRIPVPETRSGTRWSYLLPPPTAPRRRAKHREGSGAAPR